MTRLNPNSPLKMPTGQGSWIPAFAGMTIIRGFFDTVTPAKAGVQGENRGFQRVAKLLQPALVFATVFLAHSPALFADFLWDDTQYVLHNPMLSNAQGLYRIWFEPSASPQYYPLTFTSFWIEHQFFGLHPFGYHLDNVILHAAGSVLLWLLFGQLNLPFAAFTAILWGIHPLKVESVAWISERKDVLSGVFFFACLLAWEAFGRDKQRRVHRASILLFVGCLLAKTATAPLPLVLLVWTYWRNGRIARQDWIDITPFLGLAVLSGLGHVFLERANIDVAEAAVSFSVTERLIIAGRAFWFYIGKFLWPHPLMPIHPRWRVEPGSFLDWLYPAATVFLTIGLWVVGRKRIERGPIAAHLFFLLMLSPALGFISQAFNRYSFVAEHFQYLASAGLAVLFGGALGATANRLQLSRPWRFAFSLALALPLMAITGSHALRFKDDRTLFTHNLAYNPESWGVHTALGAVELREGKGREAVPHFRRARELEPESAQARYNLAAACSAIGETDPAIEHYREALALAPNYAEAHNNLALLLHQRSEDELALHHLSRAIEIKPGDRRFAANRQTILRGMRGK